MKAPKMDWDMISAGAAVASLIVSVFALHVAFSSTKTTNEIAAEALRTARQANDISLGLAREPAVIEFAFSDSSRFEFDFTEPTALTDELKKIVTIQNAGKKAVDAIAIEVIGISGLTYPLSDPDVQIAKLPGYSARLDLNSAMQPKSLAHIDVRKYLLNYLVNLSLSLPKHAGPYSTVVNMVLAPKATNEATPSSAGFEVTKNDRRLLTIKFSPSLLQSPEARAVLESTEVPHRVYGN